MVEEDLNGLVSTTAVLSSFSDPMKKTNYGPGLIGHSLNLGGR